MDLSARPSPASAAQMQDDWSRCCFCHFSFHKSSRSVGVQQNYWTGRNNKAESLLEVPLSTSCSIPWNPVLVLIAPAKEQVQNATNQFGPKEASTPPPPTLAQVTAMAFTPSGSYLVVGDNHATGQHARQC